MVYTIKLQKFEGPLDLLLQLIEQQELDITEISLARITEQYLEYLETIERLYPDDLADFLVIATKLLLIKSRTLLPELDNEEEDGESLSRQLKLYKKYLEAARALHDRWRSDSFLFHRPWPKTVPFERQFLPPQSLTKEDLRVLFEQILIRLEPVIALPKTRLEKAISLQEKIQYIERRILEKAHMSFHNLLHGAQSRTELVITFLALLELVKQKALFVTQQNPFGEIYLKKKVL